MGLFVQGSTLTEFGVVGTNNCGPGYTNGVLGGKADPNGLTTGPVDEKCLAHDLSYDALATSATPASDRLAADAKLISDLAGLLLSGQLSAADAALAALIIDAFNGKLLFWDIPAAGIEAVISNFLGTTPDPLVKTLKYVPYVDPLILDLDGDGLEITPLSQGIQFDTNGDSIKTGTAWAGADDGLLVRDLNGNGSIDTGAELFGDETLLANGQKAAHGFAALADLDKGSVVNGATVGAGDSVFDANDAQYANLHIWRDLNQDGNSQTGELQTLLEAGVQSIKLASTATNTSYGDAILVQGGTYTRTDGSTGSAGSFILAQNNFASTFTPLTASDEAMALPDIQGSGWVRDLQEAATLSPELIAVVNQAKDSPTRAGYKEAVATLLREWGNDSDYNSASKQALAGGYGLILSDPQDDQERGWMDSAIKASAADRDAFRATLTDAANDVVFEERRVG